MHPSEFTRRFSETAVLKKIRSERVQGDPGARATIDSFASTAWTEAHDKELAFAEAKHKDRKSEASYEGLLLADEDTDELQWCGQHKLCKMAAAEAQRVQIRRRGLTVGGGSLPSKETLRRQSCFVQKEDDWARLAAAGFFMVRALSPLVASVILVNDLNNVPNRLRWSAALGGCILTTLDAMVGAPGGACLKYHRAADSSRFIFITDDFRLHHRALADIVEQTGALPRSKWTILNLDGFVRRKTGAYKHRTECLGLGTNADIAREPFRALNHVLTGPDFFKIVAKVDFQNSSSGLNM